MITFSSDSTNHRTDEYGGPVQNRTKFPLEVISAIAAAITPQRTGVRLSPYNRRYNMGEVDPIPVYTHLVRTLKAKEPNLAYLSLVESDDDKQLENVDWIREIWKKDGGVFITATQHTRESGLKYAETGDVISYGQLFVSNVRFSFKLCAKKPPLTVLLA